MATPKSKANIGITLVIFFIITLVTGIIIHLKKHAIVIEPRPVLKTIHWVAGCIMVVLAYIHGVQFKNMLSAIKAKYRWFWGDTWLAIVFISLTFLTGIIKLLSPVKIPHLGLWHYWFGIIMTLLIIIHLVKGIPSWNRLRKIRTSKK